MEESVGGGVGYERGAFQGPGRVGTCRRTGETGMRRFTEVRGMLSRIRPVPGQKTLSSTEVIFWRTGPSRREHQRGEAARRALGRPKGSTLSSWFYFRQTENDNGNSFGSWNKTAAETIWAKSFKWG